MTEYIYESNMNPGYDRNGNKIKEIVRCRDCKHYCPELYNHISCEWFMSYVESDGFCSWGLPKDDNNA